MGDSIGTTLWSIKGDIRSLDYSSGAIYLTLDHKRRPYSFWGTRFPVKKVRFEAGRVWDVGGLPLESCQVHSEEMLALCAFRHDLHLG